VNGLIPCDLKISAITQSAKVPAAIETGGQPVTSEIRYIGMIKTKFSIGGIEHEKIETGCTKGEGRNHEG
jgi:hypothetical protein